jgi:3-hydroxymyristoyl/3-hydroxydecanoyl-(acyl carrier protein) dehydratase
VNDRAASTLQSPIEVPRDHPSFAGHFPKFPVLPGAVLLDAALQVIQRERAIDLTQWQIASVKFLGAVRPGDALRLEHIAAGKDGLIRFAIRVADRTVVSGSLSSATPTVGTLTGAAQPGAAQPSDRV